MEVKRDRVFDWAWGVVTRCDWKPDGEWQIERHTMAPDRGHAILRFTANKAYWRKLRRKGLAKCVSVYLETFRPR